MNVPSSHVSSSTTPSASAVANAAQSLDEQAASQSHDMHAVNAPCQVPSQLKRHLLRIFSQSHHKVELCGCIQLDMLRDENVAGDNLFLLQSISALAALYIADVEVAQLSHLKSARDLWKYYQQEAQASARLLSDRASSKSTAT